MQSPVDYCYPPLLLARVSNRSGLGHGGIPVVSPARKRDIAACRNSGMTPTSIRSVQRFFTANMSENRIVAFYARTWWLWCLFLLIAGALAIFLTPLYWLTIPGLILYSLYFALVRVEDS